VFFLCLWLFCFVCFVCFVFVFFVTSWLHFVQSGQRLFRCSPYFCDIDPVEYEHGSFQFPQGQIDPAANSPW